MMDPVMLAKELGFSNAALIDTKDIPFEPSFRAYCEANLCGQYGANWSCPPDCGAPDTMADRIRSYPNAVVLHTVWNMDYRDRDAVKHAKEQHAAMTRKLIKELPGTRGFMVGASGCGLCDPCTRTEGKSCRFPAQIASCMSAYCIHVKPLVERCGMAYDSGEEIVNFFGMYVFEEL